MSDIEQYEVVGEDRSLPAWVDPADADEYLSTWNHHPDLYAATVREVGDPEMFFGYEAPAWQTTKSNGIAGTLPGTANPHVALVPAEVSASPDGRTFQPHPDHDTYDMADLRELNDQPYALSQGRPTPRTEGYGDGGWELYTTTGQDEDDWENYLEDEREHVERREGLGDDPRMHASPHAPLFAFEPGRRDIDVMWRWVRGMRAYEIEGRAEGWERLSNLLASAEGTLRSRGRALREAWHSAAGDQSAANNFLRQVGGTMYSMSWWWQLASVMSRDLRTIAGAIDETREKLGPVWAHYQVALALWNNWGELSQLPDGTELYLTGTEIDGYELPPPGEMNLDSHHQRAGEVGPDLISRRMRINHPDNPGWHPAQPVLYDQANGASTDKDIWGPEDILEAYHRRAAEIVQPLANLYNDAHAWMPTQDGFRGPNPLELALPLDPSDLTAIVERMAERFGSGGAGLPAAPSLPDGLGSGATPVSLSAAGAGLGPGNIPAGLGAAPVSLAGSGLAGQELPGPNGGGLLAGLPAGLTTPAATPVSLPPGAGGPGVSPGLSPATSPSLPPAFAAQQAALAAQQAAAQQALQGAQQAARAAAQQAAAGTQLLSGQSGNGAQQASPPVAVPIPTAPTGVAAQPVALPGVTPTGVAPGISPAGIAPGAVPSGLTPANVAAVGFAPGAAPSGLTPADIAAVGFAPGAAPSGLTIPDGTAPVAATASGASEHMGGMMPPPPPPIVPPMGAAQNGQRGAPGAANGIGVNAMPPPPSPLFVPPGRVTQRGAAPAAPRQVQPALAGASARPARTTGLSGMRGAMVNAASQRSEPAQTTPAADAEKVTVPGVQDAEVWTVKKPKGLLQSAAPARPAQHGKPIGGGS